MATLSDAGLDTLLPNWDPPEHLREYFRHATTGDLGWLVRRDGVDCIRRDLKNEMVITYRPSDWIKEEEHYPLNRMQLAQIAFAADKELCRWLGLQSKAKVGWLDLTEEKRREFAEKGPTKPKERAVLWAHIFEALKGLAK